MSDIDVLESVLAKDATLIAGVGEDQEHATTPCPDYDVRTLVNHIVGWLQRFAADAHNEKFEGDPSTFTTDDPVTDFHDGSSKAISGWRTHGVDRKLTTGSGDGSPAQQNLSMAIMEYVAHGWDLAKATGQDLPFTDEEFETALRLGRATLPDKYRGEGMPFGKEVEVPDDAPAADRFAAFMGRRP